MRQKLIYTILLIGEDSSFRIEQSRMRDLCLIIKNKWQIDAKYVYI